MSITMLQPFGSSMACHRDTDGFTSNRNPCPLDVPSSRNRLSHLFEHCCDQHPDKVALICGAHTLRYRELDQRANQLAHYLRDQGIQQDDRVGILLPRSPHTYIALLAILKAGAAFVPLDGGFPVERITYIAQDAGLSAIITKTSLLDQALQAGCPVIVLDKQEKHIAAQPVTRPQGIEGKQAGNRLCYIIYTSGSTGNPKGVAIEHTSICNFVQVAARTYGIEAKDRIYQGMTIAFDFSIEEIWPGLISGATIIAGPEGIDRLGSGLAAFLNRMRITVFCCVPTLLATLDQDIPTLRTLIVGGEACPQHLVKRWSRPNRRMLNTYGPTEATVTATWGELYPDKPVTIGKAMPTYTIYLLDEDGNQVQQGAVGEICIAGKGLARGYVNQEEKTRQAFIPDPFNTPDNPSGRLYRTGDLGRIRPDGEIEYLGRMDTQVKIRGYRIELAEIESVILETPEIHKVVVTPYAVDGSNSELVAYCELKPGVELDRQVLLTRLRERLPVYMIPAFVEELAKIPLLANGKVDRKCLPAPASDRLRASSGEMVAPATALERRLSSELGRLLGITSISVTDDIFLDLGAHSLIVARLVSRLREDPAMQCLGLGDLYRYPTIRELATFIEQAQTKESKSSSCRPRHTFIPVSDRKVWGCGIFQVLLLTLVGFVYVLPGIYALRWMSRQLNWSHPDYLLVFLVSTAVIVASFLLGLALPLLLKRLLLPKIRPGSYALWGWFFLRFWLVEKVLAMVPLALFSGTPLLAFYYRLLGARIDKGVTLASPLLHVPDLVTIGAGTCVNTASHIFCYQVRGTRLWIEPVVIGSRCVIGSNCVLMPGSTMEDHARLLDQSLLDTGTTVARDHCWGGSPARPVTQSRESARFSGEQAASSRLPGVLQGILFAAGMGTVLLLPLVTSLLPFAVINHVGRGHVLGSLLAAPVASLLFLSSLLGMIVVLKKSILPVSRPGWFAIGSLLYVRKWFVDRLMEMSLTMANSLYATLYLAPFLRGMGARIGRLAEISTISHITPDLLEIDDESFVADIAHVGPAILARGHCTLKPVHVGRRSFIGNAAMVPGGTAIGANALIGVLSTVPGTTVPAGTTWLGSPPLHLPGREQSASFPEHLTFAPTRGLVLRRLGYEFFRVIGPATFGYAGLTLLFLLALALLPQHSSTTIALVLVLAGWGIGGLWCVLVATIKWWLVGRYRPRVRPMWSSFVWRSELVTALYENVAVPWLVGPLTGTPFLAPVMRLFGARIGKRCFIETTFMTEFDLVSVGDDCAIGQACSLQTHLFEDRVMKMANLRIGNCCVVGPRAVILYDTLLQDGVVLGGLSLVMKGEVLAGDGNWGGAPARRKDKETNDKSVEAGKNCCRIKDVN